ncbi:MAG: RsmE family RNA methyltransferase, partial [Lachnospiraceae bacterium]|nr:RsmE family RNA methyltransferase [Lachnospiraceae bacterium]
MVRLFAKEENRTEDGFTITGSDFNHVKNVLRMHAGDAVQVSAEDGRVYNCRIAAFRDGAMLLHILSEEAAGTELKAEIWLFQGLP